MSWPELLLAIAGGLLGYWWDNRPEPRDEEITITRGTLLILPPAVEFQPIEEHP